MSVHPVPQAVASRQLTSAEVNALPLGERLMGEGDVTLLLPHPAPRPVDHAPRALSVVTFNILRSGLRREALEAWFTALSERGRLPDVLALQETNLPVSVRLANEHGYHLAYYGRDGDGSGRFVNGKAWLSRLPICEAVHFTYGIDDEQREAALARLLPSHPGGPGELNEDRGALRITIKPGGEAVDLYTLHHTLGDAAINASQVRQLCGLLRAREPSAVIAGDFNANLNILEEHGAAVPGKRTTTVEAYRHRYGQFPTGRPDNSHVAQVREALLALLAFAPDTFERAPTSVRLSDAPAMSPEEARRRLALGDLPREDETTWRLQDIADGSTLALDTLVGPALPASGKRFDAILASAPWSPIEVEIDRAQEASDHTPVRAVLSR